jgi:hypothetical protein
MIAQVKFISLAQYPNRNVGEIEMIPFLFPAEKS